MQMKATFLWLEKKLKEYESIFGRIPSPEELQAKAEEFHRKKQ